MRIQSNGSFREKVFEDTKDLILMTALGCLTTSQKTSGGLALHVLVQKMLFRTLQEGMRTFLPTSIQTILTDHFYPGTSISLDSISHIICGGLSFYLGNMSAKFSGYEVSIDAALKGTLLTLIARVFYNTLRIQAANRLNERQLKRVSQISFDAEVLSSEVPIVLFAYEKKDVGSRKQISFLETLKREYNEKKFERQIQFILLDVEKEPYLAKNFLENEIKLHLGKSFEQKGFPQFYFYQKGRLLAAYQGLLNQKSLVFKIEKVFWK